MFSIFENCFISKFNVDNSYVIIPKGFTISDLDIKIDYQEAETVAARYFYEDHLVGQIDFAVEGVRQESNSRENTVQEPSLEEKESENRMFHWNIIILIIMAIVLIVGVFLKIFLGKYRGRNRRRRPRRRLKKVSEEDGGNYEEKEQLFESSILGIDVCIYFDWLL